MMSSRRLSWKIALAVCCLGMFGLAVYNYLSCYCTGPLKLTISGGNVCPLRSEMAQKICGEVRNEGIELSPVKDTNSESILADIDARRIDVGLVLGGVPTSQHRNVRQVATLGVEPLHLLVRGQLAREHGASLEMLRGRRISLGERGSNGALLAESFLQFVGLAISTPEARGDLEAIYTREADAIEQLQTWKRAAPPVRAVLAERLPDAFFLVDSLPSPLVDELVQRAGYVLVPLPYATALHLNKRRDAAHVPGALDSNRIEPTVIPAFTYGVSPAMPAADCPTFGLRLLLVAHRKVPAKAVLRLLRALDKGLAEQYHVNLDAVGTTNDYPVHPGAAAFAKDRKPLTLGQMLEPLTNFLSVLGAGAAGALALWGFVRGLHAINPDVHLRQIDRIERLLQGQESDEGAPQLPLDFIDYLEGRLAQIKQTAIEDYARGRLEKDEALVGILTLVSDTRHLLMQRRNEVCHQSGGAVRASRLIEAA
jgi:TRAP-type uncharacterized transport system substrate-binding protein